MIVSLLNVLLWVPAILGHILLRLFIGARSNNRKWDLHKTVIGSLFIAAVMGWLLCRVDPLISLDQPHWQYWGCALFIPLTFMGLARLRHHLEPHRAD